jgi:two-component system, OmpR family, heavy metal sensor histidine kinase CusS
MTTNSIRFKASVLYSSILCVILVSFSTYLYHATKRILYQNVNDELWLKAEQIVGTVNAYGEVSGGKMPPMSLMRQFLSDAEEPPVAKEAIDKLWEKHRWLLGEHNDIFQVMDMAGEVVLRSDNMPMEASRLINRAPSIRSQAIIYSDLRLSGASFRVMSYPFTFAGRRPLLLQLAVPMEPVDRVLSQLLTVIFLGIGGVLLMSMFIGSFLTHRILKPVADVTRTANNITQGNLSVRIPEEELDDELKLLVDSFNQMIDRLEKSFAHINEFSSHVAHELKTPLAIIKGELELALSGENSREEERRVMKVSLLEVDRLIRIIKDLLLLAKFEYSLNIFKMERLDLTAFVKDIFEHSKVLAAEKDIRLELTAPQRELWIQGDPTHLRRLFFNLVHNAVKFTPSGGEIGLIVEELENSVHVSVKDTGEGISLKDQARIFEKFFVIPGRDKKEPSGTGLGLCLARSIARAHGGDIVFESALQKGSTFTVTLPL